MKLNKMQQTMDLLKRKFKCKTLTHNTHLATKVVVADIKVEATTVAETEVADSVEAVVRAAKMVVEAAGTTVPKALVTHAVVLTLLEIVGSILTMQIEDLQVGHQNWVDDLNMTKSTLQQTSA